MKNIYQYWQNEHNKKAINNYPWDSLISFIRNYKHDFNSKKIKLLELGCGSGGNLVFFYKEKIDTYGIDFSETALKRSNRLLTQNKAKAKLFHSTFEKLPFIKNYFDIIVDRASLCCVPFDIVEKSISEIHRCLKKNGLFYFNTYSKIHTSFKESFFKKKKKKYQFSSKIRNGSLKGISQICFFDKKMIQAMALKNNLKIISLKHIQKKDIINNEVHAEWEVIFKK